MTTRRRTVRVRGFDYSSPGAYFVTVCAEENRCLFGEAADNEVRLNAAGRMVQQVWSELPQRYPGIALDAFVVMPDHFHGIVWLNLPDGFSVPPNPYRQAPVPALDADAGRPRGAARTMSLPDVMHRFKSMTTTRYIAGVRHDAWPPFAGRLWHRNYYEHIIRGTDDLYAVRRYIADNPSNRNQDREYPDHHLQ